MFTRSGRDSCASHLPGNAAAGHWRRMDRGGDGAPKHSQVSTKNRISSILVHNLSFNSRCLFAFGSAPTSVSLSVSPGDCEYHTQPLFPASEERTSVPALFSAAHTKCGWRASAFFAAPQLGSGTAVVLNPCCCRSQAEMAAAGARLTHKLLRSTAASSAAFPLAGAGAPAVSYFAATRLLQIEALALSNVFDHCPMCSITRPPALSMCHVAAGQFRVLVACAEGYGKLGGSHRAVSDHGPACHHFWRIRLPWPICHRFARRVS